MRALAALGLLSLTAADTLKTVRIPTRLKTFSGNRSGAADIQLDNNNRWLTGVGGYFIDLNIGTPPQRVEVLLEARSSDLWIPSAAVYQCENKLCPIRSFNASNSTTFQTVDGAPRFRAEYMHEVYGIYAHDNIASAHTHLPNFTLAVSYMFEESGIPRGDSYGVLGLGTKMLEAGAKYNFTNPTFTNAMVSAGYIGSNSYSLFSDDDVSSFGSILFGGIDTSRFTGPLVTFQTRQEEANSTWPTRAHGSRVLLDSGFPGLILPRRLMIKMELELPLYWNATWQHGLLLAYCDDAANADVALKFTLGDANVDPFTYPPVRNTTIEVPFHKLLRPFDPPQHSNSELNLEIDYSKPICSIAIWGSENDDDAILGTPFLRSAYTYYNQDEHTISFAKPAYNTAKHPTRENVVAIGKGPVPELNGTGHN